MSANTERRVGYLGDGTALSCKSVRQLLFANSKRRVDFLADGTAQPHPRSQCSLSNQDEAARSTRERLSVQCDTVCRTTLQCDTVCRTTLQSALWDEGVSTCSIHGDKQQADRDKAVQDFVAGKTQLLVRCPARNRADALPEIEQIAPK
eukprot:3940727-Rhodomonas_salina.4